MMTSDPKKVLIADDSAFIRIALKKMISESGDFIVVAEAANGRQALEALDSDPEIDVITLDYEMPGMNGEETLIAIKQRKKAPPVLIFSGHTTETSVITERLQECGADAIIFKGSAFDSFHVLDLQEDIINTLRQITKREN